MSPPWRPIHLFHVLTLIHLTLVLPKLYFKGNAMLGAIVGDIVGSRFEFHTIKTKVFDFFHENCFFTDDTLLTVAISQALLLSNGSIDHLGANAIKCMRQIARKYPNAGWGSMFSLWLKVKEPEPYQSYGNGAAMRVSACAYVGKNLEEVKKLAKVVTEVTHDHPEGLKGAKATAVAIYLAKSGKSISEIRDYIQAHYYDLRFTLDSIRADYVHDESCQNSVPHAIVAFLESTSFEDAIRNAISIGGDSDTIAAICGSIAEAYYGLSRGVREKAFSYLDASLAQVILDFEKFYPPKIVEN